ncbi:MAG: hypothetical protein IH571_05360, partial [Acholeplasmataceae bacterium]|nr:hypothetical protein [Acholeplasmataceae bacterium]
MAKRKLNFNHSDENLKKQLKGFLAYDLSLLFPNLVDDEKKRLLSIIEITKITDIFAELVVEEQQDLLRCLTKSKQGEFFRSVQT